MAYRHSKTFAAGVAATTLAILLTTGARGDDAAFNFEHTSCKGRDHEIRIIVSGIEKPVGLITADLFPNRQENFLRGRGRLKQVKFAAKKPTTQFCIVAPEAGSFAVSVYHDKNANGDFDKGPLGLPAEPWGISQNPKIRFGPPGVEETIFPVGADGAKVEIQLN